MDGSTARRSPDSRNLRLRRLNIDVDPMAYRSQTLDRWHILRTRRGQERSVTRCLRAGGVRYCHPVVNQTVGVGAHRRVLESPLFQSYVFMWGSDASAMLAVSVAPVTQAIPVTDQETLTWELAQVRQAVDAGTPIERTGLPTSGRYMMVSDGPLMGVEGVVADDSWPARLILPISAIGSAACVEVDPDLLESIDELLPDW